MPPELLAVNIVKFLAELAGLFLLGQGALYVLAGRKRDDNFVYQLFALLTRPVLRGTRLVTPKAILDRHIPYVAVLLLFWIWMGAVLMKGHVCASRGLDCRPTTSAPTGSMLRNNFNVEIQTAELKILNTTSRIRMSG